MLRNVGLVVLLAGCASSTEIPGADETVSGSSVEAETTPAASASASAAAPADACAAGDSRRCSQKYKDSYGTAHCLIAQQFCSPDGNAWLPCGVVPIADAGAR